MDSEGFDEKREARVAVQEIPGGDAFYVDLAGRSPQRINGRIMLANATAWGQLTAVLGTEATLQIDTLDSHTAVLLSLGRPAPELDGRVTATAEFLITDA